MPTFNVLVLLSLYTHVIANHLNLKYTRAVMAKWLTYLTKDIGRHGAPSSSLSGSHCYKLLTPGC